MTASTAPSAGGASVIDRLRQDYARLMARPRQLDLEVPGWNGALVARYRPLPWPALQELLQRGQDPEQALATNIDTLIEACDRIMVRQDDGELESLADVLRGQGDHVNTESGEVRYDHKLVDVLGLEAPAQSARETVLAVFAGAVSPEVAIWNQAEEIGAWMRSVSREVDAELGEDSAPAGSSR